MSETESKATINEVEKVEGRAEAAQQRWFYAALSPSGIVTKGTPGTAAGLREMLANTAIAWVDYVAQGDDFRKEALTAATQLGFSEQLVFSMTGDWYSGYEDFDTEMGLKLPAIQVRGLEVKSNPFLMLLKKNFVLTIHPLNVDRRFIRLRRYAETILKKIPLDTNAQDRLTVLLTRLIDEDNDRNFEHLRQIEERGDELNASMTDPDTPRTKLAPEIYQMKHALITYLNALWNSVDILHTLRYGDAELISDDEKLLDKLGMLAENVNRQIGLAEHMSEVLASGLEVLQSIYNNELQKLNNRLALLLTYLTIIGTAILVPNTLATMLGNAVFDIGPKDLGWYLLLMISSTVVATGLVYWWVRRRGWIPRRMD